VKKGAFLLGYARVSKADDQDTAAQVKELRQAGCKRIFEERASGGTGRNFIKVNGPPSLRISSKPMEVHFTAETEKKINELAAQSGQLTDDVLEDQIRQDRRLSLIQRNRMRP
jgi:hypothetical protein